MSILVVLTGGEHTREIGIVHGARDEFHMYRFMVKATRYTLGLSQHVCIKHIQKLSFDLQP